MKTRVQLLFAFFVCICSIQCNVGNGQISQPDADNAGPTDAGQDLVDAAADLVDAAADFVDAAADLADAHLGCTPSDASTCYRVAAVQYHKGDYTNVQNCNDDLCALSHLVSQAAQSGAKLVVLPEYSLSAAPPEPKPSIGDTPINDSKWSAGTNIKTLSKVAKDNAITLVFNVRTRGAKETEFFNSNVAVDPTGEVVALHDKFILMQNEQLVLTAGTTVNTSFFNTPAGKVGMLVCADIHCILHKAYYGKWTIQSDFCEQNAIDLTKEFFAVNKPDVVAFSAMWTVGDDNAYGPYKSQTMVAKEGNVFLIAANTTGSRGQGGGIYDPSGTALKQVKSSTPTVLWADLPVK